MFKIKEKNKINKFINEISDKGFKAASLKSFNYINNKARKIKPKNLIKSSKIAISNKYIIGYWSGCAETKNNFGDAINPILINHYSGKTPYNFRRILNFRKKPVYSVIGSILDNQSIENLEVWGSGFMYEDGEFNVLPKKVYAVRGPLTRKKVLNHGIECPEVYGDPGLLISEIYNPNIKREYKLGVIPHYVDEDNFYINKLKEKYYDKIKIIDIKDSFENVIDNVKKCEFIASSSLHGLITADAYQIPSLWIKLSDKISGGNFKYRDYMLSVGRKQMDPFEIDQEYNLNEYLDRFDEYKINIDLEKLKENCPFKLVN